MSARERIALEYQKMVYNVALRITGNQDDAEIALQETFLKVFSSLAGFRHGSRLQTWIYRITANEALQRLRARRRRSRGESAEVDLEALETADARIDHAAAVRLFESDPHSLLENRELRERLEGGISALPERHRVAFVLVDLEGLPLRDAAEAAGRSLAALKTDLHRARLFLRNHLMEYWGGAGREDAGRQGGSHAG